MPLAIKRPSKMFGRIRTVLQNIGLHFLAPRPSPSRMLHGHQISIFHTNLPIEILYLIFGFVVFDNSFLEPCLSLLQLASVCREWQTLILTNPLFWRTISLSYLEGSWNGKDNLYAEEWLKRSCNVPLTVSLKVPYRRYLPNKQPRSFGSVTHLINLVAQNHCRWQDLDLDLPLHHLSCFLSHLSGPKNSAILLRSLCIQIIVRCPSRPQDLLPSVWMLSVQSARKLLPTYFTLHLNSTPPIEIDRPLLELFISNRLRKISIGPITARSLFDIIASSENLEVADVEVKPEIRTGVVTSHYFPPPTRTMFRLQELSIVESDTYVRIDTAGNDRLLERLLQAFTLPSLNTLEYKGPTSSTSRIDVTEINEFITRSKCSLAILMLLRIAICRGEATRFLKNLPHLRKLGLDTNYHSDQDENGEGQEAIISDHFFNDLCAEPPLLPCLVYFFYEGPLTFSWESVFAVFSIALAKTKIPYRTIPEYFKVNIRGLLPDYPPQRLLKILGDLRLKERHRIDVSIRHEDIDVMCPRNQERHRIYRMNWLESRSRGRLATFWWPTKWDEASQRVDLHQKYLLHY